MVKELDQKQRDCAFQLCPRHGSILVDLGQIVLFQPNSPIRIVVVREIGEVVIYISS